MAAVSRRHSADQPAVATSRANRVTGRAYHSLGGAGGCGDAKRPIRGARRGAVLICMCHAVSHTTVIAVIEAGARSVDEIAERSQAATRCGRCHDNLVMLLAAVAEQESER